MFLPLLHDKCLVNFILKMEDFFVHCVSNASYEHYKDNTMTNFRNHLSAPLNLEDGYEVALVEVSYTYSRPLIKKGEVLCVTELAPQYTTLENFQSDTQTNQNRIQTKSTTKALSITKEKWDYAKLKGYQVTDVNISVQDPDQYVILLTTIENGKSPIVIEGSYSIIEVLSQQLDKYGIEFNLLGDELIIIFTEPHKVAMLEFSEKVSNLLNISTAKKKYNEQDRTFEIKTKPNSRDFFIVDKDEELFSLGFVTAEKDMSMLRDESMVELNNAHFDISATSYLTISKEIWDVATTEKKKIDSINIVSTSNEKIQLVQEEAVITAHAELPTNTEIIDKITEELDKLGIDVNLLGDVLIIVYTLPHLIQELEFSPTL